MMDPSSKAQSAIQNPPQKKTRKQRSIDRFVKALGYKPNLANPRTFNEKILVRKLQFKTDLFYDYNDKCKAKDIVRKKIKKPIVPEDYYVGKVIDPDMVASEVARHGSVVVKDNFGAGAKHVFFIDATTPHSVVSECCLHLNGRVVKKEKAREGLKQRRWNGQIEPKIIVEERLFSDAGGKPEDYKLHVFNQNNEKNPTIILQVDWGRFGIHTRSFFDENLHWLPFTLKHPSIYTSVNLDTKTFNDMACIAKILARPFTYARVDLYLVQGKIFFGEFTFNHGDGIEVFSNKLYDRWMGDLWVGDPRY